MYYVKVYLICMTVFFILYLWETASCVRAVEDQGAAQPGQVGHVDDGVLVHRRTQVPDRRWTAEAGGDRQAQRMVGRAVELGEVGALRAAGVAPHQVGQADDGVHRRADLVAHVGQELALGTGGGPGLVTGAGQLGGALGHGGLQVVAVALQLLVDAVVLGDVVDVAVPEHAASLNALGLRLAAEPAGVALVCL